MIQLINNILRGNYRPLSDKYSGALRDLVKDMLCKDPKGRPSVNSILSRGVIRDQIAQFIDQNQRHVRNLLLLFCLNLLF